MSSDTDLTKTTTINISNRADTECSVPYSESTLAKLEAEAGSPESLDSEETQVVESSGSPLPPTAQTQIAERFHSLSTRDTHFDRGKGQVSPSPAAPQGKCQ